MDDTKRARLAAAIVPSTHRKRETELTTVLTPSLLPELVRVVAHYDRRLPQRWLDEGKTNVVVSSNERTASLSADHASGNDAEVRGIHTFATSALHFTVEHCRNMVGIVRVRDPFVVDEEGYFEYADCAYIYAWEAGLFRAGGVQDPSSPSKSEDSTLVRLADGSHYQFNAQSAGMTVEFRVDVDTGEVQLTVDGMSLAQPLVAGLEDLKDFAVFASGGSDSAENVTVRSHDC